MKIKIYSDDLKLILMIVYYKPVNNRDIGAGGLVGL